MKICQRHKAIERKNADNCAVTEYPIEDEAINFAIVKVTGRYPQENLVVNQECKEIVYIHEGSGSVTVNNQKYHLKQGDGVLIEAGEKFYWEGNFVLFIACNPAFRVEQHQLTE